MKIKRNVLRCPFCHDGIGTGQLYACLCGALYHDECRHELSKCASCDNEQGFSGDKPIKSSKDMGFDVDLFVDAIKSYPSYQMAVDLARANSTGPLFLVGGRVYRTLQLLDIFQVHGSLPDTIYQGPHGDKRYSTPSKFDWDFLCYRTTWFRHFPKNARELYDVVIHYGYSSTRKEVRERNLSSKKKDGCYRFYGKNESTQSVDLMVAKKVVRDKTLPKNINGYLQSVPLDIQAVAFDLIEGRFCYTPGFKANLDKKRITINNHDTLTAHCELKGISVKQYLESVAAKLGFSYEYDDQPMIVK